MTGRRELLVILDNDRRPLELRVTQKISPRVVIVQVENEPEIEGALAVLAPGEELAEDVRKTLTQSEAMFVAAFAQRAQPKTRIGDGLDWDAAGFLPPDPPRKR
jgi:hypothetical protein